VAQILKNRNTIVEASFHNGEAFRNAHNKGENIAANFEYGSLSEKEEAKYKEEEEFFLSISNLWPICKD